MTWSHPISNFFISMTLPPDKELYFVLMFHATKSGKKISVIFDTLANLIRVMYLKSMTCPISNFFVSMTLPSDKAIKLYFVLMFHTTIM